MKRIIASTALILAGSIAHAAPLGYQAQIGTSELDPSIWEGPGDVVKAKPSRDFEPSLVVIYKHANVDGNAAFQRKDAVEVSGPSRISLYEVYRDSPEGTAYRAYHERFPVGTDWSKVAREWKAGMGDV